MRIGSTNLLGVHLVEMEPSYDERGFFARTYDREAFQHLGLRCDVVQTSLSHNRWLGTLRGLHWQAPPGTETKLVRVVRGRIFDVVVDLRPGSGFGRWQGFDLSARQGRAVYIPEGCAHGFLTLEDDTEVLYQMSEAYRPELVRTLRWDDPDLAITWPLAPRVISRRDAQCPNRFEDLRPARVA